MKFIPMQNLFIYRDPSECILSIRDLWLKKADGLSNVTKHNYYRKVERFKPQAISIYDARSYKKNPTKIWKFKN